ncbi:MAG: TldD/PmbA family protein [Thermodesulfovibrionales bacterium]
MRTDPEFGQRLLDLAMRGGADLAEVFQKASRLLTVEAKGGEVEAVETAVTFGYGLRVIRDGRLGFSYSNEKGEMERVAQAALESAGFTERDDSLGLPPTEGHGAPEVHDPAVAGISEEEASDRAKAVESAALSEDSRVRKVRKASASFFSNDTLIMNSRGVAAGYPSTFCSAHVTVAAEEGDDSQMGWDYGGGRFLSDVSFEAVGKGAARRAADLLGAKKITATRADVVLDSLIATEFLSVLASMLSSEAVQKGKSLLRGRVGEKVMSEILNITDDGLLPRGPGTRHVDDEGVPARRTPLVEEGVLRGFIYNTSTANREGGVSTGNAIRAGFAAVPGVGPTNLFIDSPSEKLSRGDMLSSLERGLYIMEAMGIHTANPISGEFSVGVSGLWIENGKVKAPVKEAVLSGNMLDFFGRVRAVGDDLRFLGSVGSPTLLIGPAEISA